MTRPEYIRPLMIDRNSDADSVGTASFIHTQEPSFLEDNEEHIKGILKERMQARENKKIINLV